MGAHFLPLGAPLAGGHVAAMTLTAYKVAMPGGAFVFVPFAKVHPPVPAVPLVVFGG